MPKYNIMPQYSIILQYTIVSILIRYISLNIYDKDHRHKYNSPRSGNISIFSRQMIPMQKIEKSRNH
jgi:hypothetical protein